MDRITSMKLIAAKVAGISASQNFFKLTWASIVIYGDWKYNERRDPARGKGKDWEVYTVGTVDTEQEHKTKERQ